MRSAHLLTLLVCVAVPRAGAAARTPPLAVTTDSLSYCSNLVRRVSPASSSAEVARLVREGAAMCDQGHVRGGIRQLRRALLLARDGSDASP